MKKANFPALLISLAFTANLQFAMATAGDSDLIERAKRAAAYDLKDPNSAQFREIRLSILPTIVCGEINAKNSYGAYTGFQRFTYDDKIKKAKIIYPENTFYENDMEIFEILCNKNKNQ